MGDRNEEGRRREKGAWAAAAPNLSWERILGPPSSRFNNAILLLSLYHERSESISHLPIPYHIFERTTIISSRTLFYYFRGSETNHIFRKLKGGC